MTISIQGSSAAALSLLDPLASQAAAGTTTQTSDATNGAATNAASPVIDLSGLSTSGVGGAGSGFASDASIADAAVASGSLIEGLLSQMRDAAVAASDPSVGSDARAALNAGFQSGLSQIQAAVSAAGVDGVNLIDGSTTGAGGSQAPDGLSAFDMTASGPLIGLPAGANLSDPATAATLADQLQTALGNVGQAVGALSDQADTLQSGFISAMQAGSPSFDPGLDADGARLAALQIQQTLSGGGGSIGNQSPSSILALFRQPTP
jgi:flagellin